MTYPQIFYTSTSDNKKTGNIPSQWIGGSVKESESSCHDNDGKPCPLLEKLCYAHNGTTKYFGLYNIIKRVEKGKTYSLRDALNKRHSHARYVRFGAIGDPASIRLSVYTRHWNMIKGAGLRVISYTHFWKHGSKGEHLKGKALASCDSWDDALAATSQGWRATVHVPIHTLKIPQGRIEGKSFTLCPAQRGLKILGRKNNGNRSSNPHYKHQYKNITCNTCGLCDPSIKGPDIIVFGDH